MKRFKVFCWVPTVVYISTFYRCGFKWLSYGWMEDGKVYITKAVFEHPKL